MANIISKIFRKADQATIGIISLLILVAFIFFNIYRTMVVTYKIEQQFIESEQRFTRDKISDLTRLIKEEKLSMEQMAEMREKYSETNPTDYDTEYYKNLRMAREKINYLQAELKAVKQSTESWQKFVEANPYPHLQKLNTDL